MLFLTTMVNAFVVVETVERAKHFVTQIADGVVQRLQMLLFLVPFQRELRAQQFAAHIASVARG